jgi:hypothetical protein
MVYKQAWSIENYRYVGDVSSSYCYGPIVQGRLLTHRSGGKHGDEEDLGGDSPLRHGAGKSFWTLPIFGSMVVADRDMF